MRIEFYILLMLCFWGCNNNIENEKAMFLTETIPTDVPIIFKDAIIPKNKHVHKGIFNPDITHYYYTLSNKNFTQFDIYVIEKEKGKWSSPKKAFFNSAYNDHGMSFSPDGNTLYFSSTRPVLIEGIPETWHIWKSEKINGQWTAPTFVDIPNIRTKLASHPVMTNAGNLYFHVSNLDYSGMELYTSKKVHDTFENAVKVNISLPVHLEKCTPYITPNEEYLLFATVDKQLDLWISFRDEHGNWTITRKLNDKINTLGQGNPYVTPDGKFLFYTAVEEKSNDWKIKWVNIQSELQTN